MGLPKGLNEQVFDSSARLFAILKLFFGSYRHLIACRKVVFAGSDPLKTIKEILFGRWGQVKGYNGYIFRRIEKVFSVPDR